MEKIMANEQTFIDETFRGEAQGGFYFRNVDMKHHFEKVKNNGKKVVGIIVTEGENEIELICQDIPDEEVL
tara:strand:- start:7611 stop:7823 length:213 start_codon:yes stop_codon:yes gene_type:complete